MERNNPDGQASSHVSTNDLLLSVKDLKVDFQRDGQNLSAVDGVSFDLHKGEVLGIVGESGSGKSVTVMTLLSLIRGNLPRVSGTAKYHEHDLLKTTNQNLQRIRGKEIAMVFQNPMSSLNPTLTIGDQIAEGMLHHNLCNAKEAKKRTLELLDRVGIQQPDKRINSYPHEFSGGMRQRVMIAMAVSCKPKILIADEPTTALDVTMEKQIMDLILEMKNELGLGVILITHNLPLALLSSDRVMVMYAGKMMESANSQDLIHNPMHPYTQGLFNSHLGMGKRGTQLHPIEGQIPLPTALPQGCRFNTRCSQVMDACKARDPSVINLNPAHNHLCACFLREA